MFILGSSFAVKSIPINETQDVYKQCQEGSRADITELICNVNTTLCYNYVMFQLFKKSEHCYFRCEGLNGLVRQKRV